MEALDPEHPATSSNIKELVFKIGELWTSPGTPKNLVVQLELKGLRGIQQRAMNLNTGQDKREIYKCGVHISYDPGAVLSAKIEGALKKARRKRWPICANPFHLKTMVKLMQWPHIFLWLMVLLFSLCPESVSSQVGVSVEYILFLICLFICSLNQVCLVSRDIIHEFSTQGNFPQMENIAAYKPIFTFPSRSTCGLPERSSYCQPASSHNDLVTCYQAFCVQDCPYRSSTPPFAPLLLRSHRFSICSTLMHTIMF